MSKPQLYYAALSPPSRFAHITAKEIGLDIELKPIALMKMEQYSEEFKRINPTSTVPVLVDGDVTIFDSQAIAMYLVEKYAKTDVLYPKDDLLLRTKINERLFFIASYMFPRVFQIFVPVFLGQDTEISQTKKDGILRGYGSIEAFFEGDNEYLCTDHVTLADLSLWCGTESFMQLIPIEESKFPKYLKWVKLMRKLPWWGINKAGAAEHVGAFRICLERNIATKL